MAYKEGNHAAYYNDKHLKIPRILSERKKNGSKQKTDEECGEKITIVSPLKMCDSSNSLLLNNILSGNCSRSPPNTSISPSKSPNTSISPQYSISNNSDNSDNNTSGGEISPYSMCGIKTDCDNMNVKFVFDNKNPKMDNNHTTNINITKNNIQFNDINQLENALILKLIQ